MHSVAVNLEPAQYLAGWRAEGGHLFVPSLSEARIGEEVAVRIGIHGHTIRATLFGTINSIRRVGRPALPPGVEVALDDASLPAAGFLAMAARGEPVTFRERAPRFAVERPLLVVKGSESIESTTLNVSEGGCAVRWSGDLPAMRDVVALRLGKKRLGPMLPAVVCWSAQDAGGARIGLRAAAEGRAARAWRALVADVIRSGAPAA